MPFVEGKAVYYILGLDFEFTNLSFWLKLDFIELESSVLVLWLDRVYRAFIAIQIYIL
jgi:hypothetical protein